LKFYLPGIFNLSQNPTTMPASNLKLHPHFYYYLGGGLVALTGLGLGAYKITLLERTIEHTVGNLFAGGSAGDDNIFSNYPNGYYAFMALKSIFVVFCVMSLFDYFGYKMDSITRFIRNCSKLIFPLLGAYYMLSYTFRSLMAIAG
jgi:hypothetical protein